MRLNWPGQKSPPGCSVSVFTGSGMCPVLSKFCPGAQSPFFQVSKTTRCTSELVVIVKSLPSASIASHMPPTVAVIQSKPPYRT